MLLRILAALCGLAVMGSSFVTAFRAGLALADGKDYLFAIAGVGLVGCSLVLGPMARLSFSDGAWIQGLCYAFLGLFVTTFVVANNSGYGATFRGDTVGNKQIAIERHDQARADIARLNSEIQAADASRAFTRAASLRKQLQEAEGIANAGKPASSDPQAEELSWMTGSYVSVTTVARGMPLWMSIAQDLCGSGCFFFALAPRRPKSQRERKQDVEVVASSPRPSEPAKQLVPERVDRSQWTVEQLDDYRKKRAQLAITG